MDAELVFLIVLLTIVVCMAVMIFVVRFCMNGCFPEGHDYTFVREESINIYSSGFTRPVKTRVVLISRCVNCQKIKASKTTL